MLLKVGVPSSPVTTIVDDVEIRRIICSTNAIESLNARTAGGVA